VAARLRKFREATFESADGVVSRDEMFRKCAAATFSATDHPVRAFQRRLRGIFLMAHPALLSREGNILFPMHCTFLPTSGSFQKLD
jgi:hypothetical protein